jgi:hypothetical protein
VNARHCQIHFCGVETICFNLFCGRARARAPRLCASDVASPFFSQYPLGCGCTSSTFCCQTPRWHREKAQIHRGTSLYTPETEPHR